MIALFLEFGIRGKPGFSLLPGICTFLAVSSRVDTAFGLGIAMIAVQAITIPVNHLIMQTLLIEGAWAWAGLPSVDLSFLKLISFIGVIAAVVQVLEMLLDWYWPALHTALGIFLPSLRSIARYLVAACSWRSGNTDLARVWCTVLAPAPVGRWPSWLFAAIRERLRYSDLPAGLRDLALLSS